MDIINYSYQSPPNVWRQKFRMINNNDDDGDAAVVVAKDDS